MITDQNQVIVIYVGPDVLTGIRAKIIGELTVLQAVRQASPEGFLDGFVVNLERAAASITQLFEGLNPSPAQELKRTKSRYPVYVVLGNSKLRTFTYSSSLYFHGSRKSIQPHDVRAVIEQTRSVATLPLSEHILQTYPVSFMVNDMDGVSDPIGLEASRLGVNLKIFTIQYDQFKSLSRAFEHADVEPLFFYSKILTLSQSALSEQEREEGTILVDVNQDSANFILWNKGELVYSGLSGFGDRFVIDQIAKQWNIDVKDAKKVKERYGSLDSSLNFGEELIPLIIKDQGEKCPIRRQEFHEKFLEFSRGWLEGLTKDLEAFGKEWKCYHPNYVFCGNGALVDGFLETLSSHFGINGRVAVSRGVEASQEILMDRSYAPALGLLPWLRGKGESTESLLAPQGLIHKTFAEAKSWFAQYF